MQSVQCLLRGDYLCLRRQGLGRGLLAVAESIAAGVVAESLWRSTSQGPSPVAALDSSSPGRRNRAVPVSEGTLFRKAYFLASQARGPHQEASVRAKLVLPETGRSLFYLYVGTMTLLARGPRPA